MRILQSQPYILVGEMVEGVEVESQRSAEQHRFLCWVERKILIYKYLVD